MTHTKRIHNVDTNEIIDVPLTAQEIKELEAEQALAAKKLALLEEKKAQRALLLEKLGITEEEARLLLS
jgi:hypothetical protein